jgi:hypothetical protein
MTSTTHSALLGLFDCIFCRLSEIFGAIRSAYFPVDFWVARLVDYFAARDAGCFVACWAEHSVDFLVARWAVRWFDFLAVHRADRLVCCPVDRLIDGTYNFSCSYPHSHLK